jgi:hypothetical protein
MGRKAKTLTDDQKAQLEALAACLTQEQIADYFGIARETFRAMMERDPEISRRYKKGKAHAIQDVANNLVMKAKDGDLGAMCFYLQTRAGWRETNRTEHTGADGAPLGLKVEFIE